MEYVFLALLLVLMVGFLSSGFPVAFSLPGSAILAITLAGLTGWVVEGNPDAYFVLDGPTEWLSAGVTNFRSLYWDVERDTLIAIPLFVFMGIMLQRSKIAEDLLVTMAQLFGPIPGGLGISVVFVGALLAATTGIVGATVIAMGLISLPAMMRNRYSNSLACGTICASGTLGQIIPPSIVLIILADQLSSAADQAGAARKAEYKEATGEFSMPSELDVTSASAGDMFMGALIPGLILVGIYMLYILITALLNPNKAPPVPYEGAYDRAFAFKVLLALAPPLTLIFVVLGSIITGVATVNQAGAIGAVGAMIMGSYRLAAGRKNAYYPAILAVISVVLIIAATSISPINIKASEYVGDPVALFLAVTGSIGVCIAALWAAVRAYRVDDTLRGVMTETAKTTSMVFIILIGAAMLTSAFRGFGGEELVKEYLTSLPGGFWTQFIVVMAVIFLLGFFLDFIEIAVVVVPIVAPILLMNPEANITAVWLGVMVGLNIQTSFLTPPFGFSLFYLRGVAPKEVKTTAIYKGAMAFIALQLLGLAIAGYFPSLVNYLPYRTALTSETAPPPQNPRLQTCIEENLFPYYDQNGDQLRRAVADMRAVDRGMLPKSEAQALEDSFSRVEGVFALVAAVREAERNLQDYVPEYAPLHRQVRAQQREIRTLDEELRILDRERNLLIRERGEDAAEVKDIRNRMQALEREREHLQQTLPADWETGRKQYLDLAKAEKTARGRYRANVDQAYAPMIRLQTLIETRGDLSVLEKDLAQIDTVIGQPYEQAKQTIKALEKRLGQLEGTSKIKSALYKARRALKGKHPKPEAAAKHFASAREQFRAEMQWRESAAGSLLPALRDYEHALAGSIGLRLQAKLSVDMAEDIAACRSRHKDVSLHF